MCLYDILACPNCKIKLRRQDAHLFCEQCTITYPIINDVPILLPDGSIPKVHHQSDLIVRESYNPWVNRVILQSLLDNQIVLEIGSGNMSLNDPCIVRMDIALSPYVDLVADVHSLPFLPGSLDYIFSLAVVEHLRNPFIAAQSMYEALKDGGYIYHECNFVYPYHAYPHHYFNASLQGMEQIFSQFTALRKGVATYQMPSFTLKAVLQTYLDKSHAHEFPHGQRLVQLIHQILDQDLMQYDIYFSEPDALYLAAGTYFAGLKQINPQSTIIPAAIVEIWKNNRELKERFPRINQLTTINNILVWAKTEGRREFPEIATFLDSIVTFNKSGTATPPDRSKIHSLPFEEPYFGAIGFDPHLPIAVNSRIAEENYRANRKVTPPESLFSRGLRVLRTRGVRTFLNKTMQYITRRI